MRYPYTSTDRPGHPQLVLGQSFGSSDSSLLSYFGKQLSVKVAEHSLTVLSCFLSSEDVELP